MIKSIELVNFLSYKHTKITFCKGVNGIVGLTDTGKSAIIQGFRWVNDNRPLGDDYRSHWGGLTSVSIKTMQGILVSRIKSTSQNKYVIKYKDGKKLTFVGLKQIPIQVQQALNMTSINLQSQFEPHFLLSKSSGEVAKHFNKIAHLSKIDIGEKNVNSAIRQLNFRIEADKNEVGRIQGKLDSKKYKDLDKAEKKIILIEEIEEEIEELSDSTDSLARAMDDLEEIEEIINEESTLLPAEKLIDRIIEYDSTIDNLQRKRVKINSLVGEFRKWNDQIEFIQKVIAKEDVVDSIIEIDKQLEKEDTKYSKLQSSITFLESIINSEKQLIIGLVNQEQKFKNKMGITCVLCGSKLKK